LTTLSDLETTARDFIMELHRSTEGNTEAQVSMYTIGEALGLDRDASTAAAEDLMAQGLVEIRTLAGAIGMSDQGAGLMDNGPDSAGSDGLRLGTASPLNTAQCEGVDALLTQFKSELGQSGLAFEALSEMITDIRTIEIQMTSPNPKTIIIRECFTSMLNTAIENRQAEWQRLVEGLLG
jgi:hypothetical protein